MLSSESEKKMEREWTAQEDQELINAMQGLGMIGVDHRFSVTIAATKFAEATSGKVDVEGVRKRLDTLCNFEAAERLVHEVKKGQRKRKKKVTFMLPPYAKRIEETTAPKSSKVDGFTPETSSATQEMPSHEVVEPKTKERKRSKKIPCLHKQKRCG